jgi:hypothetical protein
LTAKPGIIGHVDPQGVRTVDIDRAYFLRHLLRGGRLFVSEGIDRRDHLGIFPILGRGTARKDCSCDKGEKDSVHVLGAAPTGYQNLNGRKSATAQRRRCLPDRENRGQSSNPNATEPTADLDAEAVPGYLEYLRVRQFLTAPWIAGHSLKTPSFARRVAALRRGVRP